MERRDDQPQWQHEWEAGLNESPAAREQCQHPLEEGEPPQPEAEALNTLRDAGFLQEEIQRLLLLRRRVQSSGEIPPYLSGDPHLQFARWLYEHGAISEFSEVEEEAS